MKAKFKNLKQGILIAIYSFVFLLANNSALQAQTDKADMNSETREKINQLNDQLVSAMQNGDLNTVMELYTDDAMMMLPGGRSLRGKKEISEYLAGVKNIKNVKFNVADAGAGGKIMYQVGKATYVTIVDGKDIEQTTDFVMVLKRQPDWDYKISVNSSN